MRSAGMTDDHPAVNDLQQDIATTSARSASTL
jgi:hypothetical protein